VDPVDPRAERYASAHTTPHPPATAAAAAWTDAHSGSPQMASALVESRLLAALVMVGDARRVLEVGTFTGVGALALAERIAPGGTVITIESDPARAEVARRHIDAGPLADRIDLRVGDAREIVRELEGPFDLVFLDAWKADYIDYYEAVVPKLSDRGVLVADNVLARGQVLEGGGSERGHVLQAFNDHVQSDPRVDNVLLTVGDGLMLAWRTA
jgi:caffeoyl-CoA O-methyltransferase